MTGFPVAPLPQPATVASTIDSPKSILTETEQGKISVHCIYIVAGLEDIIEEEEEEEVAA